eukprot:136841_1
MATMLTKAISFRLLIKQLSKNEFVTFMGKIYDVNHSDLIAKSLFNYFIDDTNPKDLSEINSILSEIIQSRKPKPKAKSESTNTTTIKLDTLPKALIGNIASYA